MVIERHSIASRILLEVISKGPLGQALPPWTLAAQISRESPSPHGKREASMGLVGFWKHVAPGRQRYGQCRQSHPHPEDEGNIAKDK
eukprot:1137725-Pelagomonas_calceolata.AAC.1